MLEPVKREGSRHAPARTTGSAHRNPRQQLGGGTTPRALGQEGPTPPLPRRRQGPRPTHETSTKHDEVTARALRCRARRDLHLPTLRRANARQRYQDSRSA